MLLMTIWRTNRFVLPEFKVEVMHAQDEVFDQLMDEIGLDLGTMMVSAPKQRKAQNQVEEESLFDLPNVPAG